MAAVSAQANNSTQQHDNPANVSEAGDLLGVRDWLSNRMLDRLSSGAIQLEQNEYERARSLLGDEYDARLEQFVDVIGETDSDSDDGTDDPYRRARRSQRNLTTAVTTYDETYESYEEAIEANNETAARRHARELQRLATDVRRFNRTTIGQYERLETQTGTELSQPIRSIENVTTNVTQRQQDVTEQLFTNTTLTVVPDAATISYTNPLRVSGQLTTESGDPVIDREIQIQIAERNYTVQTDNRGRFRVRYRPRTIPVNQSSLTVRFVPATTSAYLASNDNVAVDIEQTTAVLAVGEVTDEAAFGDPLNATARLTVDGQGVDGIPIGVTIGSAPLSTETTDESGNLTVSGTLPATVPGGDRSLTATVGPPNAAVTAEPVSHPVTIRATTTDLTVNATQTGDETLAVDGRLTTAPGRAVADQPVELSVDDAVTETVQTDSNGTYSLAVQASQLDITGNATVTVTAVFDGSGTNLENATATTELTYRDQQAAGPQSGGNSAILPADFPGSEVVSPQVLGVVGALLLALVALLALRRRYASGSDGSRDGGEIDGASTPDSDAGASNGGSGNDATAADGPSDAASAPTSLDFSPAKSFVASGNNAAAVRYTYQHLRSHVAADVGAADSDTHWEFFERCRADGMNGERLDAVRDLVEAYEAVEFRAQSTAPDTDALIATVDAQWSSTTDD